MTAVTEQTGAWLESFTAQPPASAWVQTLREAGFRRFSELGFPTTHDEEWRFTNVAPIARTKFATTSSKVGFTKPEGPGIHLLLVNGALVWQSPKLPSGVQIGPIDDAAEPYLAKQGLDSNAFVALNSAFLNRGAFVRIGRGVLVEEPIEILNITAAFDGEAPRAAHPRALIVAGADSQCTIVESYGGTGKYLTNGVTEIVAGNGAVIDHYKAQQESAEAFHIASLFASLGRSANVTSTSIALGGSLVRNDVNVTLSEGADTQLNGLYIVSGSQHVDNHTSIDHAKPHAASHELYKGILDGKSSAVFNGRILVRKDAQKTDSKQTNKNLVLSDEAVIDTKPELQIFADDVRCTHGATIGQLDAESMFYLQSRGIDKSDARSLLIYAFAQEIVDRVKVPQLRDSLERILFETFHERA